jgi:hypothetical protein
MDFNLVSKNNLGAATALLLVVILSQGRFFNFLFDTALGRAILILFILFISYTNKILGVVSVLFIIIMFNNSNIGYMEGATTMGSMKKDDGKKASVTITANAPTHTAPTHTHTAPTHTAPTHTAPTHTAPTHTAPTHKKKPVEGYEGYNHLESEREGFNKKSNTIPVIKTEGFEGFEPYSGSNQQYSQF